MCSRPAPATPSKLCSSTQPVACAPLGRQAQRGPALMTATCCQQRSMHSERVHGTTHHAPAPWAGDCHPCRRRRRGGTAAPGEKARSERRRHPGLSVAIHSRAFPPRPQLPKRARQATGQLVTRAAADGSPCAISVSQRAENAAATRYPLPDDCRCRRLQPLQLESNDVMKCYRVHYADGAARVEEKVPEASEASAATAADMRAEENKVRYGTIRASYSGGGKQWYCLY